MAQASTLIGAAEAGRPHFTRAREQKPLTRPHRALYEGLGPRPRGSLPHPGQGAHGGGQ